MRYGYTNVCLLVSDCLSYKGSLECDEHRLIVPRQLQCQTNLPVTTINHKSIVYIICNTSKKNNAIGTIYMYIYIYFYVNRTKVCN